MAFNLYDDDDDDDDEFESIINNVQYSTVQYSPYNGYDEKEKQFEVRIKNSLWSKIKTTINNWL